MPRMVLPVLLAAIACAVTAASASAQSAERWQATLQSGEILYELQPLSLAGDTLVLRRGTSTVHEPLGRITELRRVRATLQVVDRAWRSNIEALAGADDQVFQMTLLDLSERRELVQEILRTYGPGRAPSD